MNYSFLPEAEAEYLKAIGFFEEKRQGLGEELIADFERVMGLIVERPESWKIVHPSGIRRVGLKRFPFSVFYRVLNDLRIGSIRIEQRGWCRGSLRPLLRG